MKIKKRKKKLEIHILIMFVVLLNHYIIIKKTINIVSVV